MESALEKELTLRDLLTVYRRRRSVIFGTFIAIVVLGALYCVICTRRYEAMGSVQVQKESADAMGLSSLMSSAADSTSDALGANINLQTQANILQSGTLALRTIEDLHLEGTQDFKPRWNPIGAVLGMVSPSGIADPPSAKLENAPQRERAALQVFSKNLKVKPVGGTRVIEISYSNPDPKVAAAVVNNLMQSLQDYNFQTRYNATNQASIWLSSQLSELRQESENLQAQVVNLQKESGVFSLGTTDSQGREQAYSGVLDRFQETTAALTQAEQNRILKGAISQAADSGDAEMLSGLAGNTSINSQGANNSLMVIQNLRQQEATQQAALQEAEAKYGPSYPKLDEMRASIASLEHAIAREAVRLRDRAKSDYAIAAQAEVGTRRQYEKLKDDAGKLNDKAISYAILRQEAEESRGLYEDLLKRLKEAGVLEGLRSSNITVIDPGRVPAKPKTPNVPLYMAVSFGVGLFIGNLAALVVDTLDNKINSIAEVEEIVGQRILGATPFSDLAPRSSTLHSPISLQSPQSTYTESVRAVRTALLLTSGASEHGGSVVLVTSAIPGEGKTLFSANLAVVLAQSNRKVLLVDIDLRRGTLRRSLGLPARPGLSEMLANQDPQSPIVSLFPELPQLHVLLAGGTPPNPSDLIEAGIRARIAQWRKEYEFIVLDSPPVLPITDAVQLNPLADITVLVCRVRFTERMQLRRAHRILTADSKHYLGVVLNGLRPHDESYYGYYGYRKYGYSYGEDNDAQDS